MPDPGEGLTEGEVVSWQVSVGDTVKINDVLCEVETAKSIVELPSPFAGTVAKLWAEPGETVAVGEPLVTIDDGSDDQREDEPEFLVGHVTQDSGRRRRRRSGAAVSAQRAPEKTSTDVPAPAPEKKADVEPVVEQQSSGIQQPARQDPPRMDRTEHVLAKPPARRLAADLGIDLSSVTGTGPQGAVTRSDVKAAAEAGQGGARDAGVGAGDAEFAALSVTARRLLGGAPTEPDGHTRKVPVHGVRKVTAKAMKDSLDTKALVTAFLTCDVTPTMELVDRLRADRRFKGLRVSPLTVWCKAVCLAMGRTPVVNARWDDATEQIVFRDQINLGIAAATPRGLMVPVVRNAQDMTMLELAEEITRIVAIAKEGKLQPADYTDGTFSITNVGVFGLDAGTPVVNRTESAILVLGAIARRPWVVGTGDDERVVPRWVTTMSLGFDHRLIDGEEGSTFLHDVAEILSDPASAMLY
ncbi:dihydrolipoamide acetyltransferase family protein [Cutibacterium equinum]|uniref:Dihydrolipoamide acetyltransferase component of pyruvate dehydrogenase complex n=1 Tax=Cutibacterium equinum TaxID=3016342 RepID=A0ABY7R1L5_9ACTN|nr:dihydrolipoamide acetyltransferase family protein [Cutibacterium equinum]WCC81173.1 dihydrolipoamide acetyltransferase family protein [Cutibacterium equinum]